MVTALAGGGFVVAWQSAQDVDGYGVYQQRYDATGHALGGETQVNTYTTSNQAGQALTGLADGGWLVTWQSGGQDNSDGGNGVYHRQSRPGGRWR